MANYPVRRGKAVLMTLTPEADTVLRSLVPSPKKMGQFVSGLILQEVARAEERKMLRDEITTELRAWLGVKLGMGHGQN